MHLKFKDFIVGDLFDTERGKGKYTRGYGIKHPGSFPVYSASNTNPLTFIDSYDYHGSYLSWATNGYGGAMKVLSGHFSINGDRALLIPKIDGLNLDYCRLILEPLFRENAVGRKVDGKRNEYTKLSPSKVAEITFQLPVTANDEIDTEAQTKMVVHASRFGTLKASLSDAYDTIKTCIPVPSLDQYVTTTLQLTGNWFEFVSTKTGWTKAQYSKLDTGNDKHFPVYSAARQPVAYVQHKERGLISADEITPIISFAANGDGSAGANFVFHTTPFFVSNDRTCLRILDKNIVPEYIFFVLQGMKQTYGFGHTLKATKANLEIVTIDIPITATGAGYDKKAQKKLIARFRKLHSIRKALDSQLAIICASTLVFSS